MSTLCFIPNDTLMMVRPSPVVALNRAIAIAQRDGPDRGIEEIQAIADAGRLTSYPFYWAALGEFELRRKGYESAQGHFRSALALARSEAERHFFSRPCKRQRQGSLSSFTFPASETKWTSP